MFKIKCLENKINLYLYSVFLNLQKKNVEDKYNIQKYLKFYLRNKICIIYKINVRCKNN